VRIPEQTQFYVDSKILRKWYACTSQREQFRRLWPKGRVFLTLENYTKAVRGGLSLSWLEHKLFDAYRDVVDKPWSQVSRIYDNIQYMDEDASNAVIRAGYNRLVTAAVRLATARAK
jgi:hypothetical protein